VIDGEDVIQEAMLKALEAFSHAGPVANLEGWIFRIAHNAALDFLRRRVRRDALHSNEDPEMILDPVDSAADRQLAATSLRTFMRVSVPQRSSVILMDVLGYSLDEIATITDVSIPAVKSALHRGRSRLREFANEPHDFAQPSLSESEHSMLAAYVDRFNARDFDAVRDMLAEEVRLELVGRSRLNGRREVSKYFYNYGLLQDWYFVSGSVEGHAAVIARDSNSSGKAIYFVLLEWKDERVVKIRDFYHARYVMEGAELHLAGGEGTVVK
jgi:RNA polymerase sigma-70 factor (ECF subfamily)